MKVGDIVICVDNINCNLTIGRKYVIEQVEGMEGELYVHLTNDLGILNGYMDYRFQIDESARVTKILELYGY